MTDQLTLNKSTLMSCVILGLGTGMLSMISLWFLPVIIIPLVMAYFVGDLIYMLGLLDGSRKPRAQVIEYLNKSLNIKED